MRLVDFESSLGLNHRAHLFREREAESIVQARLRQARQNVTNVKSLKSPKVFPVNRAYGHANRIRKSLAG